MLRMAWHDPTEINSLPEYIALVDEIYHEWDSEAPGDHFPYLWFRGQTVDKPLLPRVIRPVVRSSGAPRFYNELHVLNSFAAHYRNYTTERFEERSCEFFSFMQHHSFPTRLLDWTEAGLFGLYFAVAHNSDTAAEFSVVWIMNPGALNKLTTERLTYTGLLARMPLVMARMHIPGYMESDGTVVRPFWDEYPQFEDLKEDRLRLPLAFYPVSAGNQRIATQRGVFTIHGSAKDSIESLFHNDSSIKDYLIKVIIPHQSVDSIRDQLRIAGVSSRSVFPDLAGLAEDLSNVEYYIP